MVGPFVRWPPSPSACRTKLRIARADGSNSRAKSHTPGPARLDHLPLRSLHPSPQEIGSRPENVFQQRIPERGRDGIKRFVQSRSGLLMKSYVDGRRVR